MKLSLNWIKDYVRIPEDMDISRLVYDLTMSTVEVEGALNLAEKFENIVVGIINEVLPHPNADRLALCRTDMGGGEVREIVCGGTNLRGGLRVAVARPGAMVCWHGEGEPVKIGNAKVRGVESYGMICAASEIGLSELFPSGGETEILDLSGFDAEAGTPLADALGLNDTILEIDNKSLTNRPDLWGHYGIAREISALYEFPLKEFAPFAPPPSAGFAVTVDDPQRCPRYIGVRIEGLCVQPAPFAMQSRIWRVGMRPTNAIVDITNYVMLAAGQPTHAFDAERIQGHITVRRARDAEKLLLLNGKEFSLSGDDLVIADDAEAVALAGVMGGEKDSVLPETKSAILEIANFEAIAIRHTAAKYKTRTEAATRYEKAIDPERCDIALSLAMGLFAELFPGMAVTGFCDCYPNRLSRSEIDVSLAWLEKRLGIRIPNEHIAKKLTLLGFDVRFDGDTLRATAPTWRSTGDVSIPDDIMEEVARLYGFENFEPTPITTTFTGAINQLEIDMDRKIREYLAFRCGMREIFTYPWMSDEYVDAIFQGSKDMLVFSTPPSPQEHYIRSSHLPNLCKAVAGNLRFFSEFAIFESAQVFFDLGFGAQYDARESLPLQCRKAAGAFVGASEDLTPLFRRAKGVIEDLPRYVHLEPLEFEKTEKPVWADDILWLNIRYGGKRIGDLALLSKKASLDSGIKNSAVMLFELNIDALTPFLSRTNKFTHLAEYPMTDYDLSMLFDLSVKWADIQEAVTGKNSSTEFLRSVSFVDEYRGRQVPQGKKSVTLRLVIGSLKKTLTSDEIESCAQGIVKRLRKNLGGELRSS